jgi:hypothetical protein
VVVDHSVPEDVPTNEATSSSAQRHTRATWVAGMLYLALGWIPNAGSWLGGPSTHLQIGGLGDLSQGAWFLSTTPYAILHGQNPFFTSALNVPDGVNLVTNTSVQFLGFLLMPLTFFTGPIFSANVVYALGFSTSALACFFLLRRIVRWIPAAFLGGLLYGFSPYAVAQGSGHINWVVAVSPPLVLLLFNASLIERRWKLVTSGVALGLITAMQFLTSSELLADLAIECAIAVLFLTLFGGTAMRKTLTGAWRLFATAFVVLVVIIAYPLWMMLEGPQHIVGSAQPSAFLGSIASDLAGLVIPTGNQWLLPSLAKNAHYASSLIAQARSENGSYLGIPLLLFLSGAIWILRKNPFVKFAAAMLVTTLILSFGVHLSIDGYQTPLLLPFALLNHSPLLNSIIPARFSVFVALFAALLFAISLDWLKSRLAGSDGNRQRLGAFVAMLIALVCLAPLVPPIPYAAARVEVPKFFTSKEVDRIPMGTTLLTFPFPRGVEARPMLWQALNGFRYNLPGGYVITPDSNRHATFSGVSSVTETLFSGCSTTPQISTLSPSLLKAARDDLRQWGVSTIVVTSVGGSPSSSACARNLVDQIVGKAGEFEHQIWVWWSVKETLRHVND